MKKKIIFTVLGIVSLCGVITAAQDGNVELKYLDCSCCESATNTTCFIMLDNQLISCGKGYNICDMEPPID